MSLSSPSTSMSSLPGIEAIDHQPCAGGSASVLQCSYTKQPLDAFDATFFTLGSSECDPILSRAEAPFAAFAKSVLKERHIVQAGALRMLNKLCRMYEVHNKIPPTKRMKFVDHSHAALVHHPCASVTARPEIVAVPATIAKSWSRNPSSSIAWHHVAATVHVALEVDDRSVLKECERSLGALNQARPDLLGCFSMAIYRSGFRIVWSDRSTSSASEDTEWMDAGMVVYALGFIHFLYSPFARDPTISLDPSFSPNGLRNLHGSASVWLVNDDKGGTYRSRVVISVGDPETRFNQNWVVCASEYRASGASSFSPCAQTIVKDSWLEPGDEPASEGAILRHLHVTGDLPGVCQLLSAFRVPTVAARASKTVLLREKHRLILDGTGQDLYSCTSIVEFFMIMYDVLEVLKHVHQKHGVLHRDISAGNILRRTVTNYNPTHTSAKFSGDILSWKYPQVRCGPRCTLIDFDHAFWSGSTPERSLCDTVGTRPFVSRAVTSHFDIYWTTIPPPIKPLTGTALECYVGVCGEQAYEDAIARPRVNLLIEDDVRKERAHFSPHHDAESCYWVILRFLLTALPAGANAPTQISPITERLCQHFDMPEFGGVYDQRDPFFSIHKSNWHKFLHGDLQQFGLLLHDLTRAVSPIYEYCDPLPSPYHLHDTLQHILLQEICRVLDAGSDVRLNVDARQRRRGLCAPSNHHSLVQGPSYFLRGRKRVGEELYCPDEAQRRRLG